MKLLEPIEIKGMKLKNRIAFAPFFNMPAGEEDGEVTDLTIRWLEERAKGGAGFIMTGALSVWPVSKEVKTQMLALASPLNRNLFGLGEDKYIPGFKRMTDVIHSYDCKIGAQLSRPIMDPAAIISGEGGAVVPSLPPYPSEKHSIDEPWDIDKQQAVWNVRNLAKN